MVCWLFPRLCCVFSEDVCQPDVFRSGVDPDRTPVLPVHGTWGTDRGHCWCAACWLEAQWALFSDIRLDETEVRRSDQLYLCSSFHLLLSSSARSKPSLTLLVCAVFQSVGFIRILFQDKFLVCAHIPDNINTFWYLLSSVKVVWYFSLIQMFIADITSVFSSMLTCSTQ